MKKLSFISKTIDEAIRKINRQMKNEGIVFLYDSEDDFYHPDDMILVEYENGEDYADGHWSEKITRADLNCIYPYMSDAEGDELEFDLSHFTTKEKLGKFIESGFQKLKDRQRIDYIRGQKSSLREKIGSIENELHFKQRELDKAKAELEDFEMEEKLKQDKQ